MKDADCAETNEKSIFQISFLELIAFTIYGETPQFPSVSPTKKNVSLNSGQIYMTGAQ